MRSSLFTLAVIGVTLLLQACAASTPPAQSDDGPLTPMPMVKPVIDPDNQVFMKAIKDYIEDQQAPLQSRYEFARVDLDNDGRREGIILFTAPRSYWCQLEGCRMVILQAHNDGFSLSSEIAPVRGPITVSATSRHEGWRDLIVRQSGLLGFRARNTQLRFDGQRYPRAPYNEPTFEPPINKDDLQLFP